MFFIKVCLIDYVLCIKIGGEFELKKLFVDWKMFWEFNWVEVSY